MNTHLIKMLLLYFIYYIINECSWYKLFDRKGCMIKVVCAIVSKNSFDKKWISGNKTR